MGLSSLQLDAFVVAARLLNFSEASKEVHITQSALSQRIKALEEELGLTLFVRLPRGVKLTESGTRLLRYCKARDLLETELLEEISDAQSGSLGGVLRIAGYSSIARSVLLNTLTPLLKKNPKIQLHLQNNEVRELQDLLMTGVVDFVVSDTEIHRNEFEVYELGIEEYVMIESTKIKSPPDLYFDHDPEDKITHQFFKHQRKKIPKYKRSYVDEVYAIIQAVQLGLGKAVVSKHLIKDLKDITIIENYKSLKNTVYLYHHRQALYTRLHKSVVKTLTEGCATLLSP